MPNIDVKEIQPARDGNFDVIVSIDGAPPVPIRASSDADLDRQVLLLSTPKTITLGVRDVQPPTPQEVIPPTPEQEALSAWLVEYRTWQKYKAAVDTGLAKTISQADVDAQYDIVKAGYQPEYKDYLL